MREYKSIYILPDTFGRGLDIQVVVHYNYMLYFLQILLVSSITHVFSVDHTCDGEAGNIAQ